MPQASELTSGWEERWDREKSEARLLWVEAIRVVYAAGLGLLGISAPERMARPAVERRSGSRSGRRREGQSIMRTRAYCVISIRFRKPRRGSRGSRLGTLLLASLGVGCVVFAVVAQSRRKAPPATHAPDPLGELVAQAKGPVPAQSADLGRSRRDLSRRMLSDDSRTTTALAAVRPIPASSAAALAAGMGASTAAPHGRSPAVVPLPAKNIVVSVAHHEPPARHAHANGEGSVVGDDAAGRRGAGGGLPAADELVSERSRGEAFRDGAAPARASRLHRAGAGFGPRQLVPGAGWGHSGRRGKPPPTAPSSRNGALVPFIVEPPKDTRASARLSEARARGPHPHGTRSAAVVSRQGS